jgi:HSP20 family protein
MFGDAFEPFFDGEVSPWSAMWTPHVDIVEKDDAYVLRADLPGLTEKDIDVQFHNGVLTLRGQRKMAHDGYRRQERAYGAFSRSFALEMPVEADKISATYTNGVLEIHVPKAAEAQTKRIPVQSA